MLTIRRNIRLPKIPNEPVIHEPDIQFKTEIDEKQMKYMWLPFSLPTVTERIRLEWVTLPFHISQHSIRTAPQATDPRVFL